MWGLRARAHQPNVVLILTDDQGVSDVSCYWQPSPTPGFARLQTPHIDRLAREGAQFDSFYNAASVCTPSRASLLTGCYPPRVGFGHKQSGPGVLTPESDTGLNPDETTLAEVLKSAGYATGCVGKWHLGHRAAFLPTAQGFDGFYGIPYSNNQRPLPLLRDTEVVRMLPENPLLEGPFTQAAVTFIHSHAGQPFFLYLAHSAPHWPWNVADPYRTDHPRGIYGDVISRIDWSVGEVLRALEETGVLDDTIVIFLSDNGPWIDARTGLGGASWPFRGGKSDSWEGGVRTPCVVRWPTWIPAGTRIQPLASAMDWLPTLAAISGADLPSLPIDGHDIGPLLKGEAGATTPYDAFAYYARGRLEAVRVGDLKRVFENPMRSPPVASGLYDLAADPGEQNNQLPNAANAAVPLEKAAARFRADLGDVLTGTTGTGLRPVGRLPS